MFSWWNTNTTNTNTPIESQTKTKKESESITAASFPQTSFDDFIQQLLQKTSLLEQKVHQCSVSNEMFYVDKSLKTNDSFNLFTGITHIHLDFIKSIPPSERKYFFFGLFHYVKDQIPYLDQIKYQHFFQIVWDKINEPSFLNVELFNKIREELKEVINKNKK